MARRILSSAAALLFLMLMPAAWANWNEQARITFNEPVQIPGRVLKPGTYIFKGFDPTGANRVIQIFQAGETAPIAAFETLPVYRPIPRTRPVITFEERSANRPEAVRELFFRNDNYGHQFIYSR